MMYFDKSDIVQFDKIHRINLMNSLSGYKSANLIGSISPEGEENVAVFSSLVHLGSNPPLLGFILRPTTVPRNTYQNLKETGGIERHCHYNLSKEGQEGAFSILQKLAPLNLVADGASLSPSFVMSPSPPNAHALRLVKTLVQCGGGRQTDPL